MHTGKGTTYESLMLANRLHDIIKPYGNYKVYFATSGSDCIEAALRISVLYQQIKEIKVPIIDLPHLKEVITVLHLVH